jgi:hypothetical protein
MATVGFFPMIADERQMIVQYCKSTAIRASPDIGAPTAKSGAK